MIPSLYMSLYRLVIDTCSGCLEMGTPRDIWHHFNNKQHKQVLAMLVQASEVGASSYAGSVWRILCLLDVQLGYISEISTINIRCRGSLHYLHYDFGNGLLTMFLWGVQSLRKLSSSRANDWS